MNIVELCVILSFCEFVILVGSLTVCLIACLLNNLFSRPGPQQVMTRHLDLWAEGRDDNLRYQTNRC